MANFTIQYYISYISNVFGEVALAAFGLMRSDVPHHMLGGTSETTKKHYRDRWEDGRLRLMVCSSVLELVSAFVPSAQYTPHSPP